MMDKNGYEEDNASISIQVHPISQTELLEKDYVYEEIIEDVDEDGVQRIEYFNVEDDGQHVVFLNDSGELIYPESDYRSVYYEEEILFGEENFGSIDQAARLEMYPENYSIKSSRPVGSNWKESFEVVDFETTPSFLDDISYDRQQTLMQTLNKAAKKEARLSAGTDYDKDAESVEESGESELPDDALTSRPNSPLGMYYTRRFVLSERGNFPFLSLAIACNQCLLLFKTKNTYEKHVESHKTTNASAPTTFRAVISCPIDSCAMRSDCNQTLVEHVRIHHEYEDVVIEQFEFLNIELFQKWKAEMEQLTLSKYVRSSGKRNRFSQSIHYICHQSGNATPKPGVRMRQRGSKKLGRNCTAFLSMKENEDGSVIVRGCLKHTGHEPNVHDVPLSKEIKNEIAILLLERKDYNEIVEYLRDISEKNDRRHYIKVYEVANVYNKMMANQEALEKTTSPGSSTRYANESGDENSEYVEMEEEIDVETCSIHNVPPYAALEEVESSPSPASGEFVEREKKRMKVEVENRREEEEEEEAEDEEEEEEDDDNNDNDNDTYSDEEPEVEIEREVPEICL